jgi:hypothetical protein
MTSSEVVELLRNNLDEKHGVVNVRAVIDSIMAKEDPAQALEQLLKDNSVSEWHYYGLEGLRSLAIRGDLKPDHARMVLNDLTVRFAQERGADEYYNSIRSIAVSPKPETALVVLEFAGERLDKQDWGDWCWLAFFAVGTFLERESNRVPSELAHRLQDVVGKEREETRRAQLTEIVNLALERG